MTEQTQCPHPFFLHSSSSPGSGGQHGSGTGQSVLLQAACLQKKLSSLLHPMSTLRLVSLFISIDLNFFYFLSFLHDISKIIAFSSACLGSDVTPKSMYDSRKGKRQLLMVNSVACISHDVLFYNYTHPSRLHPDFFS